MMNKIFYISLLFMFTQAISANEEITAEQWEKHHTGESLLQIPALNKQVNVWLKQIQHSPRSTIELHYPGGEEGELWVQELADWLVSLGIPSKSIQFITGSGADDVIQVTIRNL